MAVDDIFRLTLEGLGPQGQQIVNNLYYRQTSVAGDDAGTELIDGWYAACAAALQDLLSDTCAFTEMHTRNLTQPLYGLDYSLSPALAGNVTGECLPPSVAGVLQFTTGFIGKRARGRNYLWPTGESMQNQGQWTVTYSGLATAYGNLLAPISNSGAVYQHVTYSPPQGGTGQLVLPVTEVALDVLTRTQRRRTPGVGS